MTKHRTPEPKLPTYRAAAAVLEREPGGIPAELGWTVVRAAIVAPGFLLVGVRGWKVVWGALLSSSLVTAVVLARLYGARQRGLGAKAKALADGGDHGRVFPMAKKKKRRQRRNLGLAACSTETLFMQTGIDMVRKGRAVCSAVGRRSLERAQAAAGRGDCVGARQLYRAAMRACPAR